MSALTVKFTAFPNSGAIPSGVPNFHSPEAFREYVRLYWLNYRENQELQITDIEVVS